VNIEAYMAVRARYIYGGRRSLTGSILDKPDGDDLATCIDDLFVTWLGASDDPWVDTIERKIAQLVDSGSTLPVTNTEMLGFAQWFAAVTDLADIPSPMPRQAVLYLAKGLRDNGKYSSMLSAINDILSTKTFFIAS
jgi:hypothetical protein